MVMPARPGAGLVLVQSHVTLLRLELCFYTPPGTAHAGQGLQRCILRSIGQVVARFAAVQVPAVDSPVDLSGLAPVAGPLPLGAELVSPLPLETWPEIWLAVPILSERSFSQRRLSMVCWFSETFIIRHYAL